MLAGEIQTTAGRCGRGVSSGDSAPTVYCRRTQRRCRLPPRAAAQACRCEVQCKDDRRSPAGHSERPHQRRDVGLTCVAGALRISARRRRDGIAHLLRAAARCRSRGLRLASARMSTQLTMAATPCSLASQFSGAGLSGGMLLSYQRFQLPALSPPACVACRAESKRTGSDAGGTYGRGQLLVL